MAEGKESREFDGTRYLLEHALTADFALLKGHKADTAGNLVYRGTSQNFNAVMATAAGTTVVEVDEVVKPDRLTSIDTPGIYVDRIVVP
jgi:acyl CoA:acetate/3-ketoacid CoA transferase alpha subunit